MNKRTINPAAIVALKEALASIYWYKNDLRTFLQNTLDNPSILSRLNWDNYKRQIVDRLVDFLVLSDEKNQDNLLNLIYAVVTFNDFSHLAHLEQGQEKITKAQAAVQSLKKHASGHIQLRNEREEIKKRRAKHAEKMKASGLFQSDLEELQKTYAQLVTSKKLQERGYELEKIMKSLFDLFDLDPKASFRTIGEQIDGAFILDGTDFLFEAKWPQEPVGASDLDSLSAKVRRKLDNTLGLFLAINGYSDDSIQALSQERSVLILMDGSDLMAVLEGRIDLKELLLRKKRHAAQTGEINFPYKNMLV